MEPKLLLVEDEPGMLEEMETYLHREGVRALTARTGKKALAIARSERPDLVVQVISGGERHVFMDGRKIRPVCDFGYRFGEPS